MKLTFLGTGSAFTTQNFQTNILIEANCGKKLLFDAGGDIKFSLAENNLSYSDIDMIYISHLHADHIGGLEYFAFCSFFDDNCNTIKLLATSNIIEDLWDSSLKGGLGESGVLDNSCLGDFFDVVGLDPYKPVILCEDTILKPVEAQHVRNMPCYGITLKCDGHNIYITGDGNLPENLIHYIQADIIIQDCETSKFKSGVHAHYSDLLHLPEEIRKKIYLVHYQDNNEYSGDEFKGFVKKGHQLYGV